MKSINKNTLGFTVVEFLLIVLVIALIGFGGYYVWHSQHKHTPSSVSVLVKKPTTTSKSTNAYAGWMVYSSSYQNVSFKYPTNWKLVSSTNPDEISQSNEPHNLADKIATLTSPNGVVLYYYDASSAAINDCPKPGQQNVIFTAVTPISVTKSPYPVYVIQSGNQIALYSVTSSLNQPVPVVGSNGQCNYAPQLAGKNSSLGNMAFTTNQFFPTGTPKAIPANQTKDFKTAELILKSFQYN